MTSINDTLKIDIYFQENETSLLVYKNQLKIERTLKDKMQSQETTRRNHRRNILRYWSVKTWSFGQDPQTQEIKAAIDNI